METIEQYINALFAKLPASLEILHLKDEVLDEARASFVQLREEGMEENAAVGSVLSSIGSLSDILERHGVPYPTPECIPTPPEDSFTYEAETLDDETEDYLDAQYNVARMNAIGVGLCVCAPAFPIFFDSFPILFGHWIGDGITAIGFFGSIAIAVMLFIYANSMYKSWRSYPYSVHLTAGMREELRRREADYAAQRTGSIALGVGLCIFSPAMPIFLNDLGMSLMFLMVAFGVYHMILSGVRGKACRKLLKNA